MDEGSLVTRLCDDLIPAKPLIDAARYMRNRIEIASALDDELTPAEKFTLIVLSYHYYFGEGSANALPDDVVKFVCKLREIREKKAALLL